MWIAISVEFGPGTRVGAPRGAGERGAKNPAPLVAGPALHHRGGAPRPAEADDAQRAEVGQHLAQAGGVHRRPSRSPASHPAPFPFAPFRVRACLLRLLDEDLGGTPPRPPVRLRPEPAEGGLRPLYPHWRLSDCSACHFARWPVCLQAKRLRTPASVPTLSGLAPADIRLWGGRCRAAGRRGGAPPR